MKYTIWITGIIVLVICIGSQVSRGQSQYEMNVQAAKEAKQVDDVLNKTYKELLAALDAEGQEKLKVSQRAWIKFRDAECEFEADQYRGGSIMPLIYSNCQSSLTEARTTQLKAHLKDLKER